MDTHERQRRYKEAVEEAAPSAVGRRMQYAYGVSNSAKIVPGGLFAFNMNFESWKGDGDQLVVNCLLSFPPEDQVYFSIIVSDMATFTARLEEMRAAGIAQKGTNSGEEDGPASMPDALPHAAKNNNVRGYIGRDGKLYLRNSRFWDSMPDDLATVSKPVAIDRVLFGIYPPRRRRAAVCWRAVRRLSGNAARSGEGTRGATLARPFRRGGRDAADAGDDCSGRDRRGRPRPGRLLSRRRGGRFHTGLNFLERKHFVILSGLSGTGKTRLGLAYARAVHGLSDMDAPDPFLAVCAVRPEWTDPTGLTGYYDVLSNRYVVPPFLETVMLATAHDESPVFVVLDEMNLSRVEYYLSDVLSCIETGEPLQLHSNSVPLEGSTGTSIPAEMPLPPNLYLIGTINVDETTSPVSDKVLDRAVVIDMSNVEIDAYLTGLARREPELGEAVAEIANRLTAVHGLMAEHGLGFGYRVAEEVVRYRAFAKEHVAGASADETLDDLMVQKVLVKLRGTEKQRGLLDGLLEQLAGSPRAAAFLNRLVRDLDEFGSFQAER